MPIPSRTLGLSAAITACTLLLPGCRTFSGQPGGDLSIQGLNTHTSLLPNIRTAAYKRLDDNTADLYFSDLPEDRLLDTGDRLTGVSGSIIHIHYFLTPSAGNTPIDETACNITIRHILLASGEGGQASGIYGGGGFLFPSGTPGDSLFGGTIRAATHRLLQSSPNFNDALGVAALNGKVLAPEDETLADAIGGKMRMLMKP